MSRANPVTLFAILAGLTACLGAAEWFAPALFINFHDGDVLHLFDMVFRMTEGQVPHLDFMTPLGILSYWPVALFVEAGFGAGKAVLASQVALAVLLLVPAWWVAWSRFGAFWSAVFGGSVLVMALALIHGGPDMNLSMSMHYNRWAWALGYLAIAIAFLRPIGGGGLVPDVLVLGTAMAALALLKVTYTVALAPPIVLMLALRREYLLLGLSVLLAFCLLGLSVLVLGLEYWVAYAANLVDTARSELRDWPGLPPLELASAANYIAGSLLALAAVMFLRTGGRQAEGLGVLVLFPAVILLTAQNFGNDPKWMWLLGLIVMAYRPETGAIGLGGADVRQALTVVGFGLLVTAAPSFANMVTSPLRNLGKDREDYVSLLPNRTGGGDLLVTRVHAMKFDIMVPGDGAGSGLEWARASADRPDPVEFLGETFPECQLNSGLLAWSQTIASDLATAGYDRGQKILNADLLDILWILEPGLVPVEGAAPWYYGGLPGWEAATHLLVPLCPVNRRSRDKLLDLVNEQLAAGSVTLTEVRRTPLYALYAKAAE